MIKIERFWEKQQPIVGASELQDQIAFDIFDRLAKKIIWQKTPATPAILKSDKYQLENWKQKQDLCMHTGTELFLVLSLIQNLILD